MSALLCLRVRDLERAVGVGERLQPDLRDQLTVLLTRYPKRRGSGTIRTLLTDPSSGVFTRSQAEEKLLELVRAAGLPKPEMNVMLHGYEVDCLWRDARLVVEVDGYAFHGSHRAFVHDRRRDSVIIAAGMRVLRLTWRIAMDCWICHENRGKHGPACEVTRRASKLRRTRGLAYRVQDQPISALK